MSVYQYDPADWLVSLTRAVEDYAKLAFDPALYDVRMSYPNPDELAELMPLKKVLVHFERDNVDSPLWCFGVQGVDEWSDESHLTGTFRVLEAQRRLVNFDVGVWATADAGGETYRMRAVQILHDIFGRNGAKLDFNFATGGITIRNFGGGRDATDRINELPVRRTMDMTLELECFSKSTPTPDVVPESFDVSGTYTMEGG